MKQKIYLLNKFLFLFLPLTETDHLLLKSSLYNVYNEFSGGTIYD